MNRAKAKRRGYQPRHFVYIRAGIRKLYQGIGEALAGIVCRAGTLSNSDRAGGNAVRLVLLTNCGMTP
jgi:hypothetical protein